MRQRTRPSSAWIVAALLAVPAAADPPAPQPEAKAILRAGERLWTERCSSCHFVPDSAIERDRVWIELLRTTA